MTTQVPIAHSELYMLVASNIPGQVFQLRVSLPERYYDLDTTTYPVLYLLDGDYCFAMATDVLRYLNYSGEVPEMILVAIAYDSVKMASEGGKNMRVRDLTPSPAENRPGSGGAENFRRFVKEEVFPFIESNYRVAPGDRALWGHSLGGLFGLYVLFHSPEFFRRYIIVSPALRYGNRDAFDLEEEFSKTHGDFPSTGFALSETEGLRTCPVKLFLAVGEFEYYYPPFPDFVRA